MTFTQALARIEEHWKAAEAADTYYARVEAITQMGALLDAYADSIVQLGKIAERMHEFILYTQCYDSCIDDYTKLMKGG